MRWDIHKRPEKILKKKKKGVRFLLASRHKTQKSPKKPDKLKNPPKKVTVCDFVD